MCPAVVDGPSGKQTIACRLISGGGGPLYPNRPGGAAWTEMLNLDGSTTDPGGRYATFGWDWTTKSDPGNPTGSGSVRSATYGFPDKGYGLAEDNEYPDAWDELYYKLLINFEEFDDIGCKLLWFGCAEPRTESVVFTQGASQMYVTRETGGGMHFSCQNGTPQTNDLIGTTGANLLSINGSTYHLIEVYVKANSVVDATDGIGRLWVDDVLIFDRTDYAYAQTRPAGAQALGWTGDIIQQQSNDHVSAGNTETVNVRHQAIFVRGQL